MSDTPNDTPDGVIGEFAGSKVAAIFPGEAAARDAASRVRQTLSLSDAQVQVVTPRDRRPGRKLEPESHGIFRTLLQAHLKLGIAGLGVGVIAWFVLKTLGIPFIVNNGMVALAVLAAFGAVAGLMLGGLVTLRPDHDVYIHKVYEAMGEGRSAVVVHAFDADQRQAADALLNEMSGEVVSTL